MTPQITYRLLKAADPAAYDAAATALQPVVEGLEQAAADLDQNVHQQVEHHWAGPAARAAAASIGATVAQYKAALGYLSSFQGLLRAACDGITDAQAYLSAAETLAADNSWQIDEYGQARPLVTPALRNRALVEQLWESLAANPAHAEMQDLIGKALATAQAVDDRISAAMDEAEQYGRSAHRRVEDAAASTVASAAATQATLERAEIPPAGTDTAEVAAWWSALGQQGPAVQAHLLHDQPEAIGALDGLPAAVRDTANRSVLTGDITRDRGLCSFLTAQQEQVETEIAGLQAGGQAGVWSARGWHPTTRMEALTEELDAVHARLDAIAARLPALEALQQKLDTGGRPSAFGHAEVTMPPMYLLGFDTHDAGHAIVACGDPDTAKNVCVYVPGLNTSSNSTHFQFDLEHTQNMTLAADQDTGAHDTATVIWLGYNAPQIGGPRTGAVTGYGDARDAVAGLTGYLASLRTTNPRIAHLTLLGHSYGSLVVGESALASKLPVDEIVLVGSPGVGAQQAGQLNIDPSRVWTATAPEDPVARLEWFGVAPTDAGFGANQFTVDATGGSGLFGQHGEYFDDPSHNANHDTGGSSLANIGHIITGQTTKVVLVHPALAVPSPRCVPSPPPGVPRQIPATPDPQP